MTADEFYILRDDRTNRCLGNPAYVHASVCISLDDAAAATYSGQVTFLLAINLTARWCRRVRVVAPTAPIDPRLQLLAFPSNDLSGFALALAAAADPFGTFDVGEAPESGDWLRLHVGTGTAHESAFRVLGSGWMALGGTAVIGTEVRSEQVLGAALAACIGAAWLFRSALKHDDLPENLRLSLWNLGGGDQAQEGPSTYSTELGRVTMIGCGAVGSCIAYLMPLVGVRGELILVDKDVVDVTNLNRSPLFFFNDCRRPKVDVVAEYLRRAGLKNHPVQMWFDEALRAAKVFEVRPDLVIPAANEQGVRLSIQNQVPPLQVYGTTGRDWQAFLGRHLPLKEDCLACRFPVEAAAPVLKCASVKLETDDAEDAPADATLPFLSMAAAVMAAAELVKADMAGYPRNANFACLDFRGPLTDFFAQQTPASGGCPICKAQKQVWSAINRHTRFVESESATRSTGWPSAY